MSKAPKENKRNSVFGYLAILFAAAFFMLLLAYFMQQRNNSEMINTLQNSVAQFKTTDELREENESLREEATALRTRVMELEAQLAQTQTERDVAQQEIQAATEELALIRCARDSWAEIFTIEQLYQSGSYELCAAAVDTFLSSPSLAVPDAAAGRFQEITQVLQNDGWLTTDSSGRLHTAAPQP